MICGESFWDLLFRFQRRSCVYNQDSHGFQDTPIKLESMHVENPGSFYSTEKTRNVSLSIDTELVVVVVLYIRFLLYLRFPGHLTRMWVVSLLDVVGLRVCTSSSRLIFGWFEETSREFLLSSYHFQRTQVVFNNNRNGLYF